MDPPPIVMRTSFIHWVLSIFATLIRFSYMLGVEEYGNPDPKYTQISNLIVISKVL